MTEKQKRYVLKYEARMDGKQPKFEYEDAHTVEELIAIMNTSVTVSSKLYHDIGLYSADYPVYIYDREEETMVMTTNEILKRMDFDQ